VIYEVFPEPNRYYVAYDGWGNREECAAVRGRAGERMRGAAGVEVTVLHQIDVLHNERSAACWWISERPEKASCRF